MSSGRPWWCRWPRCDPVKSTSLRTKHWNLLPGGPVGADISGPGLPGLRAQEAASQSTAGGVLLLDWSLSTASVSSATGSKAALWMPYHASNAMQTSATGPTYPRPSPAHCTENVRSKRTYTHTHTHTHTHTAVASRVILAVPVAMSMQVCGVFLLAEHQRPMYSSAPLSVWRITLSSVTQPIHLARTC